MYTTGIIQTSQAFHKYTNVGYNAQLYMALPLAFLSPLVNSVPLPIAPFSTSFYFLGTLLAVTGSVRPGPRLLVN